MKENIQKDFFEDSYYDKRGWIASANLSSSLFMFTKTYMGEEDEIGRSALKDFIITLAEAEVVPKYIVFWSNAVELCTEESGIIATINNLEKKGIKILVGAQSLEKLKLKASLRAGDLANNFDLIDAINQVQKVVTF